MAADSEEEVLFEIAVAVIKKHFDREEFEEAMSHVNHACKLRPTDSAVYRCKVFALLNLSNWSEALQACESWNDPAGFATERAYCLYRLNRFQESLDALKGLQGPVAVRLEAQVQYRMGLYDECIESYEKLHREDPNDVGPLVNAMASAVSGDRPSKAVSLAADRHELLETSYELSFNMASALIDLDRLTDAEVKLQQAKTICLQELAEAEEIEEDQLDVLEDHEELAAIQVQQAVLLQRKGALEEANELYSKVLRQTPGQAREVDITVLAVACNNVVTLRSEGKSLFDSLKRINIASKESLEHKLTRKQTIEIAINKCMLLLQAHKVEEARRETQRLAKLFPGNPRVAILQASIAYVEKKTKVCEEILQTYHKEHPGSDEVIVTLAQLFTQQNRVDKALEVLTQLPVERRSQPKTLEVMAALHQKQKNQDKAVVCVREAVDYWTKQKDADEDTLALVFRIAARLAKQLKADKLAAEVYQLYLEKVDGSDLEALCELVKALGSTDPDRAEQYATRLKVPDYSHFDPEELEQAPIPKMVFTAKKKQDTAEAETTAEEGEARAKKGDEEKKAKKKKQRKIRYPKNFDPENPGPAPDPERWLPKRERAEHQKRMRKQNKKLERGPQGGMPVDDAAFRNKGPSTAHVEVTAETVKGKPRNQGRKKGKK